MDELDLDAIERDTEDLARRYGQRDGSLFRMGGPFHRLVGYVRDLVKALREERHRA